MIIFVDFDETLVPFRTSKYDNYNKSMCMFKEAQSVLKYLTHNHKVVITSRSRKPEICKHILRAHGFDLDGDFLGIEIYRTESYHKKEHTRTYEVMEQSMVLIDDNPKTIEEVYNRGIHGILVDPKIGLTWDSIKDVCGEYGNSKHM